MKKKKKISTVIWKEWEQQPKLTTRKLDFVFYPRNISLILEMFLKNKKQEVKTLF